MPNTVPDSVPARPIRVAVGVIINHSQQILIALRPEHAHQGGLWEFPGGKVEAGESVQRALARELFEELGITPVSCKPLVEIRHDYSDKSVLLDVWWVDQFNGQPEGKEGQPICWVEIDEIQNYQFPEANQPIISHIQAASGSLQKAAE